MRIGDIANIAKDIITIIDIADITFCHDNWWYLVFAIANKTNAFMDIIEISLD